MVMSTKHHISRELIERAKYINLKKLKGKLLFSKTFQKKSYRKQVRK